MAPCFCCTIHLSRRPKQHVPLKFLFLKNAAPYYKPLTGIRAIAAYLVFFHHYIPHSLKWASAFFNELHIGVTIFFTLSGFLITTRYFDQNRLSRTYLSRYFLNRVARIYPTYLLLTCCAFIFIFHNAGGMNAETIRAFLLNVSFLRGFSDSYKFSGIAQGWSLTVEETFYLMAPLLLYALNNVTSRRYLVVLSAFVLMSFAIGAVLTETLHGEPYGFFKNYRFLFMYTFFGRAAEFATGAGLSLWLRQRPTTQLPPSISKFAKATWLGLTGVVVTVPLLMWVQSYYHVGVVSTTHWTGMLVNNVGLPLFVAILFYGLVTENTRMARLLATPTMQVLGKSSYCFYLVHFSFIPVEITLRLPILLKQPLFFVMLVLISICLHYWFEEPVNRWIRHLFRKPVSSTDILVPPKLTID